jgi:hypothetical protein
VSRTALAQPGCFTVEVFDPVQSRWVHDRTKDTVRQAMHAAACSSQHDARARVVQDGLVVVAIYRDGRREEADRSKLCIDCGTRYAQGPDKLCRACERHNPNKIEPVRRFVVPLPPPPAPRPRRFTDVWIPGEGRRTVEIVWDGT